jgi:transposase, IS5 family
MSFSDVSKYSLSETITTGYTGGGGFLEEINRALDWGAFEGLLAPMHRSTRGAPGCPPATMLKIFLLQEWYTMSDPAAEEAVRDRMSFRRFCGIPLDRDTPDHASIRSFRQTIESLGLSKALLAEANHQIDARGLVIERGTLVGATLIATGVRRPYEGDGDVDTRYATRRKPHSAVRVNLASDAGGPGRQPHITSPIEDGSPQAQPLIEGEWQEYVADIARDGQAFREAPRSAAPISSVSIDSAATKLTDTILGYNQQDLADTLKAIATQIGVSHIAYLRLSPDKSVDTNLLTAVVTYSRSWQARYFLKQYVVYDPVISHGRDATGPFDWANLPVDDPATKAFFADAANHNVGRQGLSIPLRNRRGVFALVSFTSDLSADEWELYKANNLKKLQLLSALIDSAANINFKLPSFPVSLSNREEQCLIWAARGKTYQEIAEILKIAFGSVKTHLDSARHKLRCMNLTHAVAVAFATGVIPAQALK